MWPPLGPPVGSGCPFHSPGDTQAPLSLSGSREFPGWGLGWEEAGLGGMCFMGPRPALPQEDYVLGLLCAACLPLAYLPHSPRRTLPLVSLSLSLSLSFSQR